MWAYWQIENNHSNVKHNLCFVQNEFFCLTASAAGVWFVTLSLYGPWSWGTSYYATHVGTMVCCYGDCQGSQSIIGVYPRQEQGYSPSIRTRFNLPHSLDHTLRSTQSQRDKGKTEYNTIRSGCDLVDRLFSIHIPGRKTLFKHSVVGLMRHCRVCFWRGQDVSQKKQTEKKDC